jgi:hypothetical protein
LAKSAKLRPLLPPAGAEPRYTPSAKLAAFVRARDLTCRAPGCDRAAIECDLDHTIPYADGGATHASNLKCVCRIQDGPMTFCRGLVSAAKHSVFGAGFPAEDSVSASSATAGFVEALDVAAHGFDFGPRATISAATSATRMLDRWETLVSYVERVEGIDAESFHDHALGLTDDVSAIECGLKLQLFVLGDERVRDVGRQHCAHRFGFGGKDIGCESEQIQCPHSAVMGVELERQHGVDASCYRRLGELGPPRILAQVVA